MIIFGINLIKCSATEIFEKLEHEVELMKTTGKICYNCDKFTSKRFHRK